MSSAICLSKLSFKVQSLNSYEHDLLLALGEGHCRCKKHFIERNDFCGVSHYLVPVPKRERDYRF